jgi:uncharacterized protein YjbJ (UPF0337 family)
MNLEVVAGRWKQVQGAVLRQWGRFTDNRFAVFVGEQYCINGRIQERLGQLRTASRGRRLRHVP